MQYTSTASNINFNPCAYTSNTCRKNKKNHLQYMHMLVLCTHKFAWSPQLKLSTKNQHSSSVHLTLYRLRVTVTSNLQTLFNLYLQFLPLYFRRSTTAYKFCVFQYFIFWLLKAPANFLGPIRNFTKNLQIVFKSICSLKPDSTK